MILSRVHALRRCARQGKLPQALYFLVCLALASGAATGLITNCQSPALAKTSEKCMIQTKNWVHALAYSPDGKTLASGGFDNSISLRDPNSGTLLRNLIGHKDCVAALAFSPDGLTLASAGYDGSLILWDPANGKELHNIIEGKEQLGAVAFSPDGKIVACGSGDHSATLWEVASGKLLQTLSDHEWAVTTLAFNPDGKTLATGSVDGTVKIWDLANGQQVENLPEKMAHGVEAVSYSPNGHTLVAASSWGFEFYDVTSWKKLRTITDTGRSWGGVQAAAFSPDGRTLAAGGYDNLVTFFDVASGTELRILPGHTGAISCVAFSPDGSTLASAGADNSIRLWDADWSKGLRAQAAKESPVASDKFCSFRDLVYGVELGQIKYVAAETHRDPQLEKALRLGGWDSGAGSERRTSYLYNKIDLNGDGKLDAVVSLSGPYICGSGGCPAVVARATSNGYSIVDSQTLVHEPIIVRDSRTKGWKDLIFCSRYGYFPSEFNGSHYANSGALKPGDTVSGTAFIADQNANYLSFSIQAPASVSDWETRFAEIEECLNQQDVCSAANLLYDLICETKVAARKTKLMKLLTQTESAIVKSGKAKSAYEQDNRGYAWMYLAMCYARWKQYDKFGSSAQLSYELLGRNYESLDTFKADLLGNRVLFKAIQDKETAVALDILAHSLLILDKSQNRSFAENERSQLAADWKDVSRSAALMRKFDAYKHCAEQAWKLEQSGSRQACAAGILKDAADIARKEGNSALAQELLKYEKLRASRENSQVLN